MDEYPAGSLDHSIPFLLTLGVAAGASDASGATYDSALSPLLLKEQAILIRSEAPALDNDQAHALLRYIQEHDASDLPCNSRETSRRYRFRVRTAERSILLPPRRARLPDGLEIPPTPNPPVLHSPYSPLSPISPLYPDGLIDTQWTHKHQEQVPSVLLCFYTLVSDPALATLCDNQIKTDVNNIRGLLGQSGYKTRIAVVLVTDHVSYHSVEGVQERLENIRKGCAIDSKTFFLVPSHESQEELERMAENMLVLLQGVAIEYYRDLGRHSRKKRGRGVVPQPTIPPTSGTSQTLSLAGWNVRYDFKSAIFAEYRLEMDNALRSFEQAYENLLSSELMEVIPSWSPRWNEARFLADVIAVRCLRCLLWNGQHSMAARRWQFHRERMADLIDRRGRGTNNYGWEAWEARWATVMANLIEKAEIPEFAPSSSRLYLLPEKAVMGERLQPWELLHHTGYWYRMAAKHLSARRAFARAMPKDDRRSPSFSPASQVASKAFTYDTYMCPEPHEEYPLDHSGVDHSQLIVECLIRARKEFLKRQQVRCAAELSLECARELVSIKDWPSIVELLRPIWRDMPFRTEGWLGIAEELSWILRTAAAMTAEADLVVAIDWELLNKEFTRRTNWPYDITRSLDGITPKSRPNIHISDARILSFVSASFLFRDEEGKAGQTAQAQLTIKSNTHQGSAPILLKNVQVALSGSVSGVVLQHKADGVGPEQKQGKALLTSVALAPAAAEGEDADDSTSESAELSEKSTTLKSDAYLVLLPGQTLVFAMEIPLREPGETSAASLTMTLETEAFDLQHALKFDQGNTASNVWYMTASKTKRISRANPLSVRVLPRPPKMEIINPTWKAQYYTNEHIELDFEILNQEDVDAPAKLDVILFSEEADPPPFSLELSGRRIEETTTPSTSLGGTTTEELGLLDISLGSIESSRSLAVRLRLPPVNLSSEYTLTLRVIYHLSTNPGTPISQTKILPLTIVNPFEANYDLLPRVHPGPWPSLFDSEGLQAADPPSQVLIPKGLSQTWQLVTRYASFASEPLRILDVDILVQKTSPSVRVLSTKLNPPPVVTDDGGGDNRRIIRPQAMEEASFEIVAQKNTLDDRNPSTLDVSLVIKWARLISSPDDDKIQENAGIGNVTTLPVPRFNIFGTEPRVLASVSHHLTTSSGHNQLLLALTITIENASNHFLTFGLSMEPSEEFAFSGPKQTTLNLLPVSKRSVDYRLLPLLVTTIGSSDGGGTWIRPTLIVRDKYFQKVLRVIPTGEGMKVDKEHPGGVLIWVPFATPASPSE
ncbi:Gryzun, putative trafficking through golgi-domain-containing protein [Apodospora peruviana]|uniref:Gryzun, putative trafficking through golgi-domain-containing protein n=1 Tax=Apodospora peruviana TaxID=516989 RepID=A0AAE0M254_9PEZI|nr:Gryzun, putative trafficking through golgi-domain-containing protein [Apodospora peruviana]